MAHEQRGPYRLCSCCYRPLIRLAGIHVCPRCDSYVPGPEVTP